MQTKRKKQKVIKINDEKVDNNCNKLSENKDELMAKIAENNSYFSSLIDLIPPKIYFEGNEEIMESIENNKKLGFSEDSNLTNKSRHKRFKLDPNNTKTVSEIAQEFYKNGKNNPKVNKMEELKQKLNEKINKLKSKRGGKTDAKNLRESKKEKRKNNLSRSSKQKGFVKNQFSVKESIEENVESVEKKIKKRKLNDIENEININDNKKSPMSDKMPKIYNKDGNLVFSKFDFVSPLIETDNKKNKKKSLNKLLVKAKIEEKKMSILEERDVMEANRVKEKKLWKNAIQKSEGNKVKDNSKLIKKSIKKKKDLKVRSAKKWDERNKSLEQKMKSKADKRKRNVDERRKQVIERKLSKARKKGRIIKGK